MSATTDIFIQKKSDYHLLLIEDNPGDALLIREYLDTVSPETDLNHLSTFRDAKEDLEKNFAIYDLILLDLNLPDHKGEELIKEVLQLATKIPVIILTGYPDMQFSIKSLNLGVSDYIVKDELSINEFWKSIRYSIERNEASRQLQDSESRYRYLFENNPASILIWDLKTRFIQDSNQEAEQKYGYTKEEFRNVKVDDLHPYSSNGYYPVGTHNFKEGADLKLGNIVHKHRKKNGDIFFAEMNGHFIKYNGKQAVLLLINDVTEKVDMQEQILEGSIQAEEAERNRIASELHDGIVQQLVACGMFAETLAKKMEDDEELSKEMHRLYSLLQKTTIQTRDISHNLKSAEFENSSLPHLIDQLIRQLNHSGTIQFIYNNYLDFEADYTIIVRTNLYRSIQELCANIVKHSEATEAILTIEDVGGVLFITIKDNGKGINSNLQTSHGIGLRNVENRTMRLGGKVKFHNVKNGGFQVDMEIPVDKA